MATPYGPQTLVDVELSGVPRGPELNSAVQQHRALRSPMAMPPMRQAQPDAAGYQMTWGDFQQRNPEWMGDYWAECRALYAGGPRLLADQKVLERLFPAHLFEDPQVYRQRKARAHYFPYAGTIIDHLLAGLGTDPLKVSFVETDDQGAAKPAPAGAEWWERWVSDVADEAERPADYGLDDGDDDEDDDEGGCSLHHFLVEALREALQTRSAWVLADLPSVDPDDAAAMTSQLDAEQAGMLDPYLCVVPAEQVIDWQADRRGRLQWVMMMTCEQLRPSPAQRRGKLLYTYTIWDELTWRRYEIEVDPARPPHEGTTYNPVADGEHGFGRVPFERLQLPEGLWAMGKLHSLAREHFNKRCAMSWAEYKSLFAILYEFLQTGGESGLPSAGIAADEERATNQIRGQGYSQTRGDKDRAEFIGPPPATFVAARESCNDAMREMYRVMFSMAMSANMDSAALQRSGDSKASDNATTEVLLDAFGSILLKFARRLLVLAALGRGEAPPKANITGLEKFDVIGVDTKIAEAVQLFAGVPMLSPLVKELYLARLYFDLIGEVTQEQRETIRRQIRDGLSMEEMAAAALAGMGPAGGDPGAKPGEDDDEDPEPAPPVKPAPSKPPAGPARMTMTRTPRARR